MKNKKRIWGIVFVVAFLFYLIIHSIKSDIKRGFGFVNEMSYADTIPYEYLSVPIKTKKKNLTSTTTYFIHNRPPLSTLVYKNKYEVVQYKIELNSNLALPELVDLEEKEIEDPTLAWYRKISVKNFDIKYQQDISPKVDRIFIDVPRGKLNKIIVSSDSAYYFKITGGDLALKFSSSDKYELYTKAKKDFLFTKETVTEILLYKKNGVIYLFIYTPIERSLNDLEENLFDFVFN